MDSSSKKVLFIDLEKQTSEVKTFPGLYKYIGGVGLGLRLYELHQNQDPIIFSVGPLNGFFPYASKTSVVFNQEGVMEDIYFGGYLSTRIKFSDIDSIVIFGRADKPMVLDLHNDSVSFKPEDTDISSLGLPGKKSFLSFQDKEILLDDYFTPPENLLEQKFDKKRLAGMVITGTCTFIPKSPVKYEALYKQLMDRTLDLKVEKGFFPSCSGCPMGCAKSNVGEIGGNVLAHCLVACEFAENIYTDVGTVFSCLNILGYDYTHEDIENLPALVQNTLKSLS
jgi:hypothetical protein